MNLTLADWRNLASILLFLEAFVVLLPILVIFFFSVRGLRALRKKLIKNWLPLGSSYATQAQTTAWRVSNAVAEPLIRLKSTATGVQVGAKRIIEGDTNSFPS
jgi:hypothetical protein